MGMFRNRRPRIDRLRKKGDTEGLRRALEYRDEVRLTSGQVQDLGAPIRREAMAALRATGDEEALAGATSALTDEDVEVRLEAIRTLDERGTPGPLIETLVRSPHGPPEPVGDELRAALVAAKGSRTGVAFAEQLLAAGDEAGDGAAHAELLGRLLSNGSDADRRNVAQAAIRNLVDSPDGRGDRAINVLSAVPEAGVEALLGELDQPHRVRVAEALGTLRDSRALTALSQLLDGDDPAARAAAARALGEIRDPRAVQGLVTASTDSDFAVREAAIGSLDQLGTAAIVFAFAAFVRPLLSGGGAPRAVESARAFMDAASLDPGEAVEGVPEEQPTAPEAPAAQWPPTWAPPKTASVEPPSAPVATAEPAQPPASAWPPTSGAPVSPAPAAPPPASASSPGALDRLRRAARNARAGWRDA
jgi:hypothetical protein